MSDRLVTSHGLTEPLGVVDARPKGKTDPFPTFLCGDFIICVSEDLRDFSAWPTMTEVGQPEGAKGLAFQCRDHLEIWLETIGAASKVRPFFVSVSDKAGNPAMLIPLGVEYRHGIRILAFLDAGVSDYNAPIVYHAAHGIDDAQLGEIWRTICRAAPAFDVVLLEKMPEFIGDRRNPLWSLTSERWPISGHCLHLEDGAEGITPKRRRDLKESRRKRKRIAELGGEIQFAIATDPQDIASVFDVFVRQKSRRYMETLGHPGFDVPGQRDYYLTLTQRLSHGGAQLAYLRVGNEIIATAWSLIAGGRLYYLMAGYEDGIWRKHSPGRLLLEDLLIWCTQNGIMTFDFGIGDEAYKRKWQETELELRACRIPHTALGHIFCAAVALRRGLIGALPPTLIAALKKLSGRTSDPALQA